LDEGASSDATWPVNGRSMTCSWGTDWLRMNVSLTSVVAVVLAQVVPPIAVGPLAGAAGDRWIRRGRLTALHLAAAPVVAALALAATALADAIAARHDVAVLVCRTMPDRRQPHGT
jgi:hypothetical protein